MKTDNETETLINEELSIIVDKNMSIEFETLDEEV